MLSLTRLPLQYSERLRCSCPLLICKHAEFLLRSIDLYPGDGCLLLEKSRASHFTCAPGCRYNDTITVLIIGNPNRPSIWAGRSFLRDTINPTMSIFARGFLSCCRANSRLSRIVSTQDLFPGWKNSALKKSQQTFQQSEVQKQPAELTSFVAHFDSVVAWYLGDGR